MFIDERIEVLSGHVRRKPHDRQARDKLIQLLKQRDGQLTMNTMNTLYKAYYPAECVTDMAGLPRHPLLSMLVRV